MQTGAMGFDKTHEFRDKDKVAMTKAKMPSRQKAVDRAVTVRVHGFTWEADHGSDGIMTGALTKIALRVPSSR